MSLPFKRARSRADSAPEEIHALVNARVEKRNRSFRNERNWDEWVSASSTKNYLIKDPLLDWLSYHSNTFAGKNPKYVGNLLKAASTKSENNFTEFIMAQGNEFEAKIMEYLYSVHDDIIVDIGGNANARSEEKALDTIYAMNRGIPIIYAGVLHNTDDNTYGVPDLIVRSDWLKEIVKFSPISNEDSMIPSPLLTNFLDAGDTDDDEGMESDDSNAGRGGDLSEAKGEAKGEKKYSYRLRSRGLKKKELPKYHYRIVDIKFTTLYLRADGIHLLNSNFIPAYKSQLYIYTKALGKIQGYTPSCSYILGRKWTYKTKNEVYKGTSCVDKLGVINYETIDLEFVEKTKKAIEWIKDMRKNGANWDINNVPLCRPELYPNMSNYHDQPWHSIKKQLADENKEITDLWMCGVKNRELAIANKVYKWTDPACTAFILGVHGPQISRVLKQILKVNQGLSIEDGGSGTDQIIFPEKIQNNDENWQQRQKLEMFVDFEFVNDVISDFSKMPNVEAKAIIFMIGAGYFDFYSNEWIYKEFTVDDLTPEEECRICEDFSNYVRQEADWFECYNPLLIHWSNAENWQWETAFEKHDGIERSWIPTKRILEEERIDEEDHGERERGKIQETEPRWFDLLQVFKKEPVVVKGCLGFGLKEVAGALSKHGFIQTKWDQNNSCVDGAGAMLGAFKASKEARTRRQKLKDMSRIRDIAKYNEVDCKVVGEIMTYIRGLTTM